MSSEIWIAYSQALILEDALATIFHHFPRRHARRLANRCGLILTANTKPGRHIPFDHPSLVHMREWISFQLQNKHVHERMVGNFDQTWSLNFVPRKSSLNRRQVSTDPFAKNVNRKKLRHVIERALGLEFTNSQAGDCGDYEERLRSVTGGAAAMAPVDQWRQPHTLTTLSWIDGSIGRGYVTVKADYLGESQRSELNKELQSWIHIGPLQPRTHIWNSETFVEYMHFLTQEIRSRRRRLGLPHSATALIICDCASQHSIQKFYSLKQDWCQRNNVVPWQKLFYSQASFLRFCFSFHGHSKWELSQMEQVHKYIYIYSIYIYFSF